MTTQILSIVFIDDSALVRDLIGTSLRALGHRVTTLASHEAHRLKTAAEEQRADAVVLDVMMPLLSGDLLASFFGPREMRSFAVLLCSGMAEEELIARTRACHADGYVIKNGNLHAVARAIEQEVSHLRGERPGRPPLHP